MSQDHLELFFGCVRARGSSNNNPNSVQFKNNLRQLLFTKTITVESGNCSNLDLPEGDIIKFRSEKRSLIESDSTVNDNELETYLYQLDNVNLEYYVKDILDYIGGYIVRGILKNLSALNVLICY